MSVARNSGVERVDRDHYVTPQWCVNLLVERVSLRKGRPRFWHEIGDIGAGDGRIGRSIRDRIVEVGGMCPNLFLYEIDQEDSPDQGDGIIWVGGDFLDREHKNVLLAEVGPDRQILWVGNPPYSRIDEITEFMQGEVMPRAGEGSEMWFLVRLDWLGSQKRARWMETNAPTRLGIVVPRPNFKAHIGIRSSDSGEYAWLGWSNHVGRLFPGIVKPIEVWAAYDRFRSA